MTEIVYRPPGPVGRAFMLSDAFVRGLMGPVGSGKSSVCCADIFRRMTLQAKSKRDGKRKSRWLITRNTYPELKTTTMKTWLDWFPEVHFGPLAMQPPFCHSIRFGDVEAEVYFVAMDRPADVAKVLSLELTGAWINEAREVPKDIVDGLTMRLGRYPSLRDGGPSWYGLLMDTNPPEEDHWWPIMAGDTVAPDWMTEEDKANLVKPEGWEFFKQPGGMLPVMAPDGKTVNGYVVNQAAENVANLVPDYYPRIITGKTRSWIDVMVLAKYGTLDAGKPVWPNANAELHFAREPITPPAGVQLFAGQDFGLTGAFLVGCRDARGRVLVLAEFHAQDRGTKQFGEWLVAELPRRFGVPHGKIKITGDPAGDQRAQTDETTPFQIMRSLGFDIQPAETNDPTMRIEAVGGLFDRLIDGGPAILIDPSCRMVRAAVGGKYRYKEKPAGFQGEWTDEPIKDRWSHPSDALQYLVLALGEGRRLLGRAEKPKPVVARQSWNPLDRRYRPFQGRAR